jgi:anti-sigma factor RsiW
MSCHDFQHNLALLVGEELEVNETIAARRHVAHCPDCREALQQLNDSRTVMRAVSETPAEINGESLWPRLRAQILPATISRPQRDYPSWMPTATLAAACVALLIFVGSTPMLDRDNEPDSFVDESFQRQLDEPTDPLLYSNPGEWEPGETDTKGENRARPTKERSEEVG